jgi:hypothetical protein
MPMSLMDYSSRLHSRLCWCDFAVGGPTSMLPLREESRLTRSPRGELSAMRRIQMRVRAIRSGAFGMPKAEFPVIVIATCAA